MTTIHSSTHFSTLGTLHHSFNQYTFNQWIEYITNLHPHAIDLGLSRILPIARKLKLNQFTRPVVVVAGTNGKGSVVRTLEMLYLQAGYAVAAYTSPHLLNFNERLRINNQPCSDAMWETAFAMIEVARGESTLSFFEFTTLAALLICQQHVAALDVILLEVGLGGRLDAVNIVDSDVAVLTNVDIDHIEWLGDTREKIGYEKAGIFRVGHPVVCGDPAPPRSVRAHAALLRLPFYLYERDYHIQKEEKSWSWETENLRYTSLPLPALKLQNVATALMVSTLLPSLSLTEAVVAKTMPLLALPGRYEYDHGSMPCTVIMDVAHNPQGCSYLAERLSQENPRGKIYAVFGMLADKDIDAAVEFLLPLIAAWYVVSLPTARSASAAEIRDILAKKQVQHGHVCKWVAEALCSLRSEVTSEDIIVIFGSFYTVEAAKRFFGEPAKERLHDATVY